MSRYATALSVLATMMIMAHGNNAAGATLMANGLRRSWYTSQVPCQWHLMKPAGHLRWQQGQRTIVVSPHSPFTHVDPAIKARHTLSEPRAALTFCGTSSVNRQGSSFSLRGTEVARPAPRPALA